jgi:hypothetical protein
MTITPSDIGPILVGGAAMIGTIWTIVTASIRYYSRRTESRIMKAVESTYSQIVRDLCAQNMIRLRGVPPEQTYSFDVISPTGEKFCFPLFHMVWVEYVPGLQLQLISHSADASEVLVMAMIDCHLPLHSHSEIESIHVDRGMMQDSATNQIFVPGDTWEIPAGQLHSAWFRRGTRCTVFLRPPLKTADVQPIRMDGVESLF